MAGQDDKESTLQELRARIARWTEAQDRYFSAVPGLALFRTTEPTTPKSLVYEPSICVIAQGAKKLLLGDDALVYNQDFYLLTSVHVPTVVHISEASPEAPYLGLRLSIDNEQLTRLMADSQLPPPRVQHPSRGMTTGTMTVPLLNAFLRLLDLLDEEQDIPILAPTVQKEIIYRLLTGEQGLHLRQIATLGSLTNEVARSITWLKANFAEDVDVDELASRAQMSRSAFFHHFRSVTTMSPLQYQKHLRLLEARRLLLSESLSVATAAHQVGYSSPSQFSREYTREFGASPSRDVAALRA